LSANKLNKTFLGHPKPLFSLSMAELWERFSFYGIRPLLVLFMSAAISLGGLGIDRENASAIVGIFGGCLYLATLPGGYIADNYLGQKKAVFIGSIIIALGHLSIAFSVFYTQMFFIGLLLIVIGTGLFKTCISVMVGMLYEPNDVRRDSGFTIFYMGINIGAFFAPLFCGFVAKEYGWHLGFAIGGIGMLFSLLIFYFKTLKDLNEFTQAQDFEGTRKKPSLFLLLILFLFCIFIVLVLSGFIELNPVSLSKKMIFVILLLSSVYFLYLLFFSKLSKQERKNLLVFIVLFFVAALFWSVFEQKPTTFNLFAQDFTDRIFLAWEIPSTWFQSLNPIFIIIFAPFMSMLWIALSTKGIELFSITKFTLGIFLAGIGFMVMMFASEFRLFSGHNVSMLWLVMSIWFLTMGELCLSPVGLSIMTKIAPDLIKNQVMGLWFIASALGNVIAGLIGGGVRVENLENLPDLFGKISLILFVTALGLFLIRKIIYNFVKEA